MQMFGHARFRRVSDLYMVLWYHSVIQRLYWV